MIRQRAGRPLFPALRFFGKRGAPIWHQILFVRAIGFAAKQLLDVPGAAVACEVIGTAG